MTIFMATLLAGLGFAGAATAGEKPIAEVNAARAAAARYVSLDAALADGYQQLFECTDHGEDGAMGVHYIHPDRAGDGKLVLTEPDVLMYEPQADGSAQVVAVEYIVFEKDWAGETLPSFLGQKLHRKTMVGVHPVDPFYEMHLWHWRHNPGGLFADWNPYVSCDKG
jgi:hypothetical protein